jgi:hypothetical protein
VPNIRTTNNPSVIITVSDKELADLLAQNLVLEIIDGPPVDLPDFTEAQYAEFEDSTSRIGKSFSRSAKKTTARYVPNVSVGAQPRFTRANNGSPVLSASAQNMVPGKTPAPNIYWVSLLNTTEAGLTNPLDLYYLYYTTDHSVGGVYLQTAPTPVGPWTGRGLVYDDPVGANGNGSTETATVYVDPTGAAKLMMLYQIAQATGAVGTQSTISAQSNDGITWTRNGIALDISPTQPGDGHTGYARIVAVGRTIYAHSLCGGGNVGDFAQWVSYDGGRTFAYVGRIGLHRDLVPDGRFVSGNTTSVFRWRGQLWWVGMLSNFAGGSTPKDARVGIAPVAEDMRHLLAPPSVILYPFQGLESANYRDVTLFIDSDGSAYLYYQCDGNVFVAILEA